MSKSIEIGETVTDSHGSENTYGGESDHGPNRTTVKYDMRNGTSTIYTSAANVIPTSELAELNTKDPRITATNDKANKPRTANGPWYIETPGHADWAKTKSAGITEAARRLAIADWHEGN